jgi:hypothetical protein
MYVYVRNQDSTPLMPCTPAKARKLLQAGKAKVVAHRPFTIQLRWFCEGYVQPVTLGIDKGSTTTGIVCVGNGKALLAASVHHRQDVKAKMDARRAHRKSRRARQWYRPRQTRKQYQSLPQKGKGRVRYQVNEEREGFHKGDIVRVKGCYVKQINSIYSDGRLAFKRVEGEPAAALPKDCQVLERERTIMWENVS